jgi:chitin disaccharide deacetylase
MNSEIRLVVNGDDFGMTRSISDGIIQASRDGVLTSCSLIGNCGDLEYAAGRLRTRPQLGVGLHLTLFGGVPTADRSKVPSLLRGGGFPNDSKGLALLLLTARPREITIEFEAQIHRVLECGIEIDHLDAHLYLDQVPSIRRIVDRLARVYGVRADRHLIEPRRPGDIWRIGRASCAWVLRTIRTFRKPRRHRAGSVKSLGFMRSGNMDEEALIDLLESMPSGDYEIVCHPGLDNLNTTGDARRNHYRPLAELQALTSARVRQLVAQRGIRLCRWSDMQATDAVNRSG